MDSTLQPRTRRSFVQGGLLASLAMVASLGALPIPHVAAEKKKKKKKTPSIASRLQSQQDMCESGGGTLKIENPKVDVGSIDATCVGGADDGRSCVNYPESTFCWQSITTPDLPTEPLQRESPFVVPSQGADQPLQPDGGGVTITAYDGGQPGRAKRQGRRRQDNGKGRKG